MRIPPDLARLMHAHDVPRGASILEQGARPERLYVVVAGAFKAWAVGVTGRECILQILGPDDLVGELSSVGGERSPIAVTALVEGRVLVAPAEDVRALACRDPDAVMEIVHGIELGRRQLACSLRLVLLADTDDLVLLRLREIAARHGRSVPGGLLIDLPLRQDDLAALVGRSRETVNRTLARLTLAGRLKKRGRRFLVPEREGLGCGPLLEHVHAAPVAQGGAAAGRSAAPSARMRLRSEEPDAIAGSGPRHAALPLELDEMGEH